MEQVRKKAGERGILIATAIATVIATAIAAAIAAAMAAAGRKPGCRNRRQRAGLSALLAALLVFVSVPFPAAAAAGGGDLIFSDDGISIATGSTAAGVKIEGTQLTISSPGTYTLSGSCSDGSVKVKKGTAGVKIILNGLDLTAGGTESSATGALVCNKSTEVTIEAAAGTVNSLEDSVYNNDDVYTENADAENAVLKCKDGSRVTLCGQGELNITANGKNGIKSGATTEAEGTAWLTIRELDLHVDAKGNDAINAEQLLEIPSGTLTICAEDDAIHSDLVLKIGAEGSEGPEITVTDCCEGIEAADLSVYSGSIEVVSEDDCMNAANADLSEMDPDYAFSLGIYGGELYLYSENGDGIDSNGTLELAGGTVEVWSANLADNQPLDSDGALTVKGATVFAAGGSSGAEALNLSDDSQNCVIFGGGSAGGQQPGKDPREGEEHPEGEEPPEGENPREGEERPEGEEPPEGENPQEGEERPEGEEPPEGENPQGGEERPEGEEPPEGENPQEGEERPEGEKPPEGENPREGEERPEGEEPPEGENPQEGEERPEGEEPPEGGDPREGEKRPGTGSGSGAGIEKGTEVSVFTADQRAVYTSQAAPCAASYVFFSTPTLSEEETFTLSTGAVGMKASGKEDPPEKQEEDKKEEKEEQEKEDKTSEEETSEEESSEKETSENESSENETRESEGSGENSSESSQDSSGSGTEQENSGDSAGSGSSSGSDSSSSSSSGSSTQAVNRDTVAAPAGTLEHGLWKSEGGSWCYTLPDGTKAAGGWYPIRNPYAGAGQNSWGWFCFDKDGKMMTGWFTDTDGNRYYLDPLSDGQMGSALLGWQKIDGAWYYFAVSTDASHLQASLYRGQTTPDGYSVDEDGKWLEK